MEVLKEMSVKLEVRDLVQVFGKQKVLHGIGFSVMEGEFLSILGPSGCGKTTILRILIGLLDPTSGFVVKDGVDITHAPPSRRNMGIVFQNYALFQNMTVLGNVEYALRFHPGRVSGQDAKPLTGFELRKRAREAACDIIEQVGLGAHINKKPYKLSGGQQQRVAIARTLAMNPEIILFDEPMSALDAATRLLLREEIKRIQKRFHSTMIYITHDQEEAFALSDRIMVMDHGSIQQLDTPENIIGNPANGFIQEFVIDNLHLKINSLVKYVRAAE
ncbi:MAG: ABC transporter ATP-binding protein [Spirochaetales bacterium]|jgi:ABC-type Fe3+/spermidine/putrescine transport system ATPase subunit|nr:ABC transporter ATP-binding protein [Spirochaetales bacterium]